MIEFKLVDTMEGVRQVARLARDIWHEHYLPIIGHEQVVYMLNQFQSEDAIQQQIAQGYKYYLIFVKIVEKSVEVGYFSVQERYDKLFLSKLYVLKSFRGQGIGKQGIEFIKTTFSNPTIQLTVNKHNLASISFYQNVGFKIIDCLVVDIGNGFIMDDYLMEKR